ncbi:hypothetical protein FH972_024284 [Carpinus fangiana]|uniref:ZN622/Rei1/Reh1 zinc finger C2H2-type domain-containing protein n=1 Tax=Carpinus fangiana TaxID=176857 RepID=A0A5N6L046_9ROSI|nr:hypothetical protein FH972_024284 [Carpinus fangiana]
MSHTHGFFIPNAEYLVDMESFLSYLYVIVSIFHECLFCGKLPKTKLGAQDHMRGAGHCKLNMEHDENHFSQFYDFLESLNEEDDKKEVKAVDVPAPRKSKLFLPSGRSVSHCPRVPRPTQTQPLCLSSRSSSQRQQRSIEATTIPGRTSSTVTLAQSVAVKSGTSTSLIGLSEFQRRALLRVELNIEKMEARVRNEYQSKVDKGGNKQKTYRVCSMGKKAGGLEKRLG